MSHLLEQYYLGITQQLRSEVDFINSLFQHHGTKGEGNEAALRELVTSFIPRRYGVGTGVIIDRNGIPSNQCDIVVYDTFLYPSLLALTNVHLFPVDIVYAVIEVKTTVNSTRAKEALENIASVRSLDIVTDSWMMWESTEIEKGIPKRRVAAIAYNKYEATPPVGIIFAYNSEARRFETFKNWFMPKDDADAAKHPTMVGCLDQGLVRFLDLSPQAGTKPEGFALPLRLNDSEFLTVSGSTSSIVHDGLSYPVKSIKGNSFAIDQSRVLLIFLLLLNEMMAKKKINPRIHFSQYYLTEDMKRHISV
jgi:hypothetical protein